MEFSYFDIVVSIIILFLGLKGVINGFFKELFGLLGIIGGIFIASRVGESVGQLISDSIFKLQSSAAVSFTGFLVTLAIFWLFMVGVGALFKKLSSVSGLGVFDKTFGFIFSASKFFLIASVIAYAAYNVKAVKTNIDQMMKNSIVFPMLVKIGSVIMKLDTIEISQDLNNSINKGTEMMQESISETLQNQTLKTLEETKKIVSETVEQNIPNKESR
ncbi:MAG: CvpA family protein [Campylobacterota bacterium]